MDVNVGSNFGIVNVVVIALLLVYAIRGFSKGFVKTFFSTFGTILALLLAVLLASKVALTLENKFGAISFFSDKMAGFLTDKLGATLADTPIREATETALKNKGIDSWIINIVLGAKADSSIPDTTTISQIISPAVGYYAVLILSVIGLFIVFKIIFFLIGELVKKLHSIKIIGFTDKFLGLIAGLISATITLEIIIMITGALPIKFINDINFALINSPISGALHKINIFSLIMQWIGKQDVLGMIKKIIIK